MGTDAGYFEHYRYGRGQELQLAEGRAFGQDLFDVVLGAGWPKPCTTGSARSCWPMG